jgi:DUF971 family protein
MLETKSFRWSAYLRQRSIESDLQSFLSNCKHHSPNGRVLTKNDIDSIINKIERVGSVEFDMLYEEYFDKGVLWVLNYLYGERQCHQLATGDYYEEATGWDIRLFDDKSGVF